MPQQWKNCWYCGCSLIFSKRDHPRQRTVDHVTPKWMGGDKFVDACKACNNSKGESSVQEYKDWLGIDKFYGEKMGWDAW